MFDHAHHILVPIDRVCAIAGGAGRWCGQAALPGAQALHTVNIEAVEDVFRAELIACPHDGWRTFACHLDADGERQCEVPCGVGRSPLAFEVVRVRGRFYLLVPPASDATEAVAAERAVLEDEINALRDANHALEAQVIDVSRGMDEVIEALSVQSRALEERNREQDRLTSFVRRVMDTMDNPLIVLDRFGRIAQVNTAASQAFGCSEGALVGQPGDVLLSSRDCQTLANGAATDSGLVLFQAIASQGHLAVELALDGSAGPNNGVERAFLVHGAALYDGSGKMDGVVIVASNVTRLREREIELRESEQRFRDYSSVASDWFWATDASLRFAVVEQERENPVLGYLVDRRPHDFPPQDARQHVRWLAHLADLDARRIFRDYEVAMQLPSGECWLAVSGTPVFDRDGNFNGYRGTARDITGRKALEEEVRRHRDHLTELVAEQTADLIRAKEVAEHANRMKSEFLSNVSHELRTPLHAILSFSQLGQKRTDGGDEDVRVGQYFERIRLSGQRLTRLVDDLLNLARLESGQTTLDIKPVNVDEVLADIVATLDALLASRRQHVVCTNRMTMRTARIDGDRFAQVLHNLIGNASKFSAEGGRIAVTLEDAQLDTGGEAFRLVVGDNGPGIPEGELDDIFGKFVQSSRTKTGAGGTGLGLAICREIVHAHGGRIVARNRAEGGAEVEVLMPLSVHIDAPA